MSCPAAEAWLEGIHYSKSPPSLAPLFAPGHKEINLLLLNLTSLQTIAYFSPNGRTPACQYSTSKYPRQDTSAGLYFALYYSCMAF